MAQSGAGALYVGPGWDGALMGLDLYLRDQAVGDPVAAATEVSLGQFAPDQANPQASPQDQQASD